MLYEFLWMIYILGVGILFGLGLLGVIVAGSLGKKTSRIEALVFSLGIFIAGIYFIYHWEVEKSKIRALSEQMEKGFQHYQETPDPAVRP